MSFDRSAPTFRTKLFPLFAERNKGSSLVVNLLNKGCTNTGHQVDRAIEFCTVLPSVCGSSVWNLLHVTNLASRIYRSPGRFEKSVRACTRVQGVTLFDVADVKVRLRVL